MPLNITYSFHQAITQRIKASTIAASGKRDIVKVTTQNLFSQKE